MANDLTVRKGSMTNLVCTFRLGQQLYGIDVTDVKEVNIETHFTHIYHTPKAVLGYVNLRGQIFLVLDMRQMLGMEPCQLGPTSRLVILQAGCGDRLAVLVDQIGDIIPVNSEIVEPIEGNDGGDREFQVLIPEMLVGVARLDNELLLLLQARQFQKALETQMAAPAMTLASQPIETKLDSIA